MSARELPIGTVVCSFLNFKQYSEITKSDEKSPGKTWTPLSKWAPCDGRPIVHSQYSDFTGEPNVPDLRGVFLRGLNSFDPFMTKQPQNPNQLNPDNTPLGVYQEDAFKSHRHDIMNVPTGTSVGFGSNFNGVPNGLRTYNTEPSGEKETRPKNVSVYYYIRINN